MKEFDNEEAPDILDIVFGAKLYAGNFFHNSIDGGCSKYSELLSEPFLLENNGLIEKTNEHCKFLCPTSLSDRKHMQ